MSVIATCVWVDANVPYDVEYVVNLRAMVARHLTQPHEFVCLTDRPEQLPAGIASVRIAPVRGLAGWWSKIELFNPAHKAVIGGWHRLLYFDLDTLIVSSLDDLVHAGSFALIPDTTSAFQPKNGLKVIKRFNSSVMSWVPVAGNWSDLYRRWSPAVAQRLWGDQDWLAEQLGAAETMPAEWFPRLSELRGQPPGPDAKVVLCKKPKNAVAAKQHPWVSDVWRAA